MIGRRSGRLFQLILLVICFGISWLIYSKLRATPEHDTQTLPAAAPWPQGQAEPESDFTLPPLATYESILARPMFNANRRPAKPQEPARPIATAAPLRQLALTLKGIIADGPERLAIFVDEKKKTVFALKANDRFQGWTLTEVQLQQVTFSQAEGKQQFFLKFDGD